MTFQREPKSQLYERETFFEVQKFLLHSINQLLDFILSLIFFFNFGKLDEEMELEKRWKKKGQIELFQFFDNESLGKIVRKIREISVSRFLHRIRQIL